ncbi:MAG: DegT/DnrJ/EryC1/StrS family aminotransferase [bacterium]
MSAATPKLLITGGGSLRTALAAARLGGGADAVVVAAADDPVAPAPAACPTRLTVARGDVHDEVWLRDWAAQCDLVAHLAPTGGTRDAAALLDAEVLSARSVLRACAAAGRPVLLGSSSAVYGAAGGIVGEASPRLIDGAPAAIAALTAEAYAAALAPHGLRYVIARYWNVYGPGLDEAGESGCVAHFVACVRAAQPLPLIDGGRATRGFCFVDDAVDATLRLLDALGRGEAVQGRAYNVGRQEPVRVAELAERLVQLAGHTAGVASAAAPDDAAPVGYRVADVAALRAAVGFSAPTPLAVGLRRTLAHAGLLRAAPEPPAAAAPEPIPWVRPILPLDLPLLTDIQTALSTGRVTNDGPCVRAFERGLAAYLGVDDCVAVSSGSAALLLAMSALDLRGGAAVLPSFTFAATLNAVVLAGLRPVFCDIDPDTWTLSPTDLARLLAADASIRLVVPVTVFGVPPNLSAIRDGLAGHAAELLLDNAHGLGTTHDGARCAAGPRLQAFSLHATKILPAVEGGFIVADDPRLLATLRRLRNHGVASDPLASTLGFNAKMSELHAAVGLRALRDLDAVLARRRDDAAQLRRVIGDDCATAFTAQRIPAGVESNFQNLGVRGDRGAGADVAAVQAALACDGVETRRYFWPPLHRLQAHDGVALPITEAVGDSILCLPLHSAMEPATLDRLAAALRRTTTQLSAAAPPQVSIVAPVYNEARVLPELAARGLHAAARRGVSVELVLADDASTDASAAVLADLARDTRVRPCRLARNGGQFRATQAGLRAARGDWVVVLDGDLQDPPEHIAELIAALAAAPPQVLAVLAVKSQRHDPRLFMAGLFVFHRLQHALGRVRVPHGAGTYCIMRRSIAERIARAGLRRANLAAVLAVAVRQAGGELSTISYEKAARYDGSGRVGWRGLIGEGLESMAVTGALPRLLGLNAAGFGAGALALEGGIADMALIGAGVAAAAALAVGRRTRQALAGMRAAQPTGR